ncbi:hypothetical protein Tco_1388418, partial [Tanacetum coccineum]
MIVQSPVTPVADKATSTSVDVRYRGATTTVIGLEVGQSSGNIDKTLTMPQDSPLLRVNILGSDEGKIQGRYGHDMEFDFDFDAAKEVSTTEPVFTAGAAVTTASVVVSTVSPTRNTRVSTTD